MSVRIDSSRAICVAIGLASFLAAGSASAATLTVGDAATCGGATFTTIQSAVDAAGAFDVIRVCPGTYAEQITIPAGKDGLVLRSRAPLAAVIEAPSAMADPGDVVRVHGARWVTIEGFTIAGPLPDALFCSTFARSGLRVDGGGSATIARDRFTEIRSASTWLRGCQSGMAIVVGNPAEGETGSAAIVGTTIDAYQKNGVLVAGAGSRAAIVDSVVIGDGPNAVIAQNGIEVRDGADAFVAGNHVWGQSYAPSPLASGLLFYLPGRVSALGNHVRSVDFGVVAIDARGPEIRHNDVASCVGDGIVLGQLATGTSRAVVEENESRDNGGAGIAVSGASSGNVLRRNRMRHDGDVDARDDSTGSGTAGTANRWRRNRCVTDDRGGGICGDGDGDRDD